MDQICRNCMHAHKGAGPAWMYAHGYRNCAHLSPGYFVRGDHVCAIGRFAEVNK